MANQKQPVDAYPLVWPEGWKRTPPTERQWGAFKVRPTQAVSHLNEEIRKLGGQYPTLSSNVRVRRDGLPYSEAFARKIEDPGVAVYFERGGKQVVFACDKFDAPFKNVRAIGLTIEALRGMERYGASDMLERSLSAFEALPPPRIDWRAELGFRPDERVELSEVAAKYRELAKDRHPDRGGTPEAFVRLGEAYRLACEATR